MLTTSILNSECTWGNCIYTGNESNWLETLVNCITSGSPLANQIQGTEKKVPTFETESQETALFKELQHKKVFIDAATEDKAMLSKFKGELNSKDIKSIALTPQDNPTDMFNQLEHALDNCDEIIAFYKEAPLGWLTQRLRLYRKAQARRKDDKLTIRIHSPNTQPQGIKLPPNVRWETV